jgi:lactoylglutathione lyase
MKFGYAIVYVPDVVATVEFYERAFGLPRRMIHESKLYAEMETGATALAFAGEPMAQMNDLAVRLNRPHEMAAAYEIALVTEDVLSAYQRAVKAGASAVHAPTLKPWAQTVAYVKDMNGCLVELCSPMSA